MNHAHRTHVLDAGAFLTFLAGYCRCGRWGTYPKLPEDVQRSRWEYRNDRATPAVSSIGGTV